MAPSFRALALIVCIGLGVPPAPGAQDPAPTGAPALLVRAVEQYLANQGHWAFTESEDIVGPSGKSRGMTILQVDPSRSYTEQVRPLEIDGAPPTSAQFRQYEDRSERIANKRYKENQKWDGAPKESALDGRVKLYLGGQIAVPELESAAVVAEDERSVTYFVPFLAVDGKRSPSLDQFEVTVRINKLRGDLEHFSVRQQGPIRVKAIAKITELEEDADFTSVDPRYPSVMTHDVGRATVSVLFFRRDVSANVVRTNLRHVVNFDERFGVKLGPMRLLRF